MNYTTWKSRRGRVSNRATSRSLNLAPGGELLDSRLKDAKKVKCLIVVSDQHCGSELGLCPAEGIRLDEGGHYKPSKLQKKVWSYWQEFWQEWVPKVTRGEPFAVVNNGDAIEGKPHLSTANISDNTADQEELSYQVLKPVVEQCNGLFYMIRGTESHVGKSGCDEERLAKRLDAIPNRAGQFARFDIWKNVGAYNVHLLHHHYF